MSNPFDAIPESIKNNPYLKLDEEKKPTTYLGEIIYDFFNQKDILKSRTFIVEETLLKHFSQFSNPTKIAVEYLAYLTENDPQVLHSIVTDFLKDKALLTKIVDIANKAGKANRDDIIYKLDFISDFYEAAEFLKFPVFLLSNGLQPYDKMKVKDQIISHLKIFGLNKNDIENIRLIRNAIKHKYQVTDNFLVVENQKKIPISDVEKLFNYVDEIYNWYVNFMVRTTYLVPKFGLISIITIYFDLTDNDEIWETYVNGIKNFFSGFFKQIEEANKIRKQKKKTIKNKARQIKRKFKYFLKYKLFRRFIKESPMPKNFHKTFPILLNSIYFQISKVSQDLEIMANKMQSNKTQSTLLEFSNWLNTKSLYIKNAISFCKENPDRIMEIIENRAKIKPKSKIKK